MSSSPPAIRCVGLTKRYNSDVLAVDGLDLEVSTGECFGLLGPNGAGKTTTIEILEGLMEPTAGEVEVLGHRWGWRDRKLRQRIGISLQETRLSERLSVRETLTLFRSFYDDGLEPAEVLSLIGLQEKRRTWVGKLSGGQRQRLAIGCALVGSPELLFLDEPTTGLDPRSRRGLWELLRRFQDRGRTILLTTHYMDEAERLCDRVAIVDHGRLIALGSPAELIATLGGEHVIEFGLARNDDRGGLPDEDALREDFRNLPAVREVTVSGDQVSMSVKEPHITLPALLAWLQRHGRELGRLTTRHASLEDVFVKLTGRHLDESGNGREGTARQGGASR